ncbi:extracellular solute-binding protein [Corynebacterium sp. 153RC1]|uniref:extracellular solute-binding protein n=1 Tax=Corynebacterium TaxID=1716 RepID=UPI00211C2F88|nr:extracellular solute-binding protein [Corynebacterium sp. 76QC2CO]MCQ9351871.1 extracellular solute-binding protein [Corynebacterium sp. 209RC1]MCQ9355028.1 extracellular solute-binding protein [Corynebacterium sp. 1222RC1]MCQ9356153.1 extracellular solute-binding protein [Corynebacterium sp. 122RC1]MCQ9359548.1 extracellular solute-binding protein [Corynebacterium sp. 142RC1]MCQ9360767.1 extracellular solute-binding protein [Corynebacterium sp. 153RC1]MCQ9363811.1 extracellular solute-bin
MAFNHIQKTIAVLAAASLGLVACSSDSSSSSSSEGASSGDTTNVTLTVWSSQEDQTNDDAWLQTMQAQFAEAHPEYNITWENAVVSAADAGTTVNQDPSAAADVYVFANDQLGALLEAGAIGQLSDSGAAQLSEQAADTMAASVTGQDGAAYGLPIEPNTWFMYYDTSALTAEDVTNLDTMLEKARVSFPLSNSWYFPAFYAGAGATFFGEDGLDEAAGIDLGDRAAEVTQYLAELSANPNFINDVDGSGVGGLQNGSVDVVFSGSWDAAKIEEILGENYGVATLPTFTLGGEQIQMKAFSGSKAVAYNPNSADTRAAAEFAAFLASADSQKVHYEKNGVIPSDQTLATDATISENPVATALLTTVDSNSILQPTVKSMSDFWDPAENFGKAIANRDVTPENAAAQTEAFVSQLQ